MSNMEEIVKHINDTNASYRTPKAGDAKNTDLFLDNEHYNLFKDSGDQIKVRFSKENLSKAVLFIASILPRKYDNSSIHKLISYSPSFVYEQLELLEGFFIENGAPVTHKVQTWYARKDVLKKNGKTDNRFYFNGLIEEFAYKNSKGDNVSAKFTIRNYLAGGYSDLHISKSEDGVFDVWITNAIAPTSDTKGFELEDNYEPSSKLPLQQIVYGAPGTGKSFEINKITKGSAVIRTTFHPDSDYSTFVGAYKPIMDEVDTRVVPVVINNGISLNQNQGTYKEKRITYKFVKQAFLKAYLAAWKKYADSICNKTTTSTASKSKSFNISSGSYRITSVDSNCIVLSREFFFTKKMVSVEWNNMWETGSFVVPAGPQSGKSVQHAIAKWIYNHIKPCNVGNFEDGWNKLISTIEVSGFVEVSKMTQTYNLLKSNDSNNKLRIRVEETRKYRNTLKCIYEGKECSRKLDNKLVSILREYDSTSFDKAWEALRDAAKVAGELYELDVPDDEIVPQYLVIEEINRGNCAQIFGDLFQLLDRTDCGFSSYPIEADTDIQNTIKAAFTEEEEYKIDFLEIDDAVEDYTSNYGSTLSEDLKEGRVLLLPPNLYIWATMNTSDQSLFPIDSAFKRRWEWKYVPISDAGKEWKICVNGTEYDWWSFVEKINNKIWDATHSEDKKLGYFFCKADRKVNENDVENSVISADRFVGKVLFYIYNDVFKDYGFDDAIFKDNEDGNSDLSFQCLFKANGNPNEEKIEVFLKNLEVKLASEVEEKNDDYDSEESEEDNDEIDENDLNDNGVSDTNSPYKVTFPDGEVICEEYGWDTYIAALRKIGLDKALPFGQMFTRMNKTLPLITDKRIQDQGTYKYIKIDGYYVLSGTDSQHRLLKKMNKDLDLGLIIE